MVVVADAWVRRTPVLKGGVLTAGVRPVPRASGLAAGAAVPADHRRLSKWRRQSPLAGRVRRSTAAVAGWFRGLGLGARRVTGVARGFQQLRRRGDGLLLDGVNTEDVLGFQATLLGIGGEVVEIAVKDDVSQCRGGRRCLYDPEDCGTPTYFEYPRSQGFGTLTTPR